MRIHFCGPTVKALQAHLQWAVKWNKGSVLCRSGVLLDYSQHLAIPAIAVKWQVSPATIYNWLKAFILNGVDSLYCRYGGGRRSKLDLAQKKQLTVWLDAGPQAAGFATACWSSLLVQELIERQFGVKYARHYVIALLKALGYSFQKAQFVSDHLDEVKRAEWTSQTWPALLVAAQARGGLILFEDEASFAQWGSLSYTWSRRGHTPTIATSGKRRGYKLFGAIEFFSGRVFYEVSASKFNSQSYEQFIKHILEQTTEPIFLVQDGARYHTSAAMREFFEGQQARLQVYQLPAYSPDYNPIEYLWRKSKRRATHNKYFAEFAKLGEAVDEALSYFSQQPQQILGLFGCYSKSHVG